MKLDSGVGINCVLGDLKLPLEKPVGKVTSRESQTGRGQSSWIGMKIALPLGRGLMTSGAQSYGVTAIPLTRLNSPLENS